MATGTYQSDQRKRPGVDPTPQLPLRPTDVGPMATWGSNLAKQLRDAFSRYGMAVNMLSLLEDQERFRMRFIRRDE